MPPVLTISFVRPVPVTLLSPALASVIAPVAVTETAVSVVNWPMKRLLLSYFANLYARGVTGAPIRDLTSGFKCYKRAVLEGVALDRIKSDGYGFQIEIDFMAWRRGFKIKEIPIIFTERQAGTSKMNRRIIYQALFLCWRLRFERLFGRS